MKASLRNLALMPLPAILHWGGNHWVVLFDVDEKGARIADPATGLRRVSRAEVQKAWTGYAALFDYTAAFEKAPEGRSSAAWLTTFFRPHAPVLSKAVALALIVSALRWSCRSSRRSSSTGSSSERDEGLLRVLLLSMLGVLSFSTLGWSSSATSSSFAAVRIDAATLDFVTQRLLALPMSYFSTRKTGDIERRLQGLRNVRELLVQQGVAGLTAVRAARRGGRPHARVQPAPGGGLPRRRRRSTSS